MNVLIIPSWYFQPDSQEIGGKNFHLLAKALREDHIGTSIYYGQYWLKGPVRKKSSYIIEDGVPTWRTTQWFPPKINSVLLNAWIKIYTRDIIRFINKEGRPHMIHVQSYLASLVASEIRNKLHIPFIYTEYISTFVTGNISALHQNFIRKSIRNADLITCLSPGLKSRLEAFATSPIEVVPHFYDPRIFYFDPATKKNEIFTWISVGEPSHTKGLDLILYAFANTKKLLPDANMQLILVDEIKDKDKLMQIAIEHNMTDSVTWTGLISHEEIANIHRKGHVFISASRVETFGSAIIEAQACGLPVIATRTDGASYILTHPEQGMLTEIENTGLLANSMRDMYLAYERYNPMTIIKSVESRFSKDVVIKQWKEIYSRIAV